MSKTETISVTLPRELARLLKDHVASGAYATESDVIGDGLRALQARDAVVDEWLRTEGVARYDAYHRDVTRGRPMDEVFARLRERAGQGE